MKTRYRIIPVPYFIVALSLILGFKLFISQSVFAAAPGISHPLPDDELGFLPTKLSNILEGLSNPQYPDNDQVLFDPVPWYSADNDNTYSVAWGDVDGDGDLDLAAGNYQGPNKVYLNVNGVLQTIAAWSSADNDNTTNVAWGDVDGDGHLDLAVGNDCDYAICQPNKVYLNVNGMLQTTAAWSSADSDDTNSIAWGDMDGDGDLDLAAGNSNQPNKVYLNVNGMLQTTAAWSSTGSDNTQSVAWGDVDGDGDLDLAAGNYWQPNKVYLNVNGMLQATAAWSSADSDKTVSIAWGDVDGDGQFDLAAGNGCDPFGSNCQANKVYLNVNGMLQTTATWTSADDDETNSVAWGDVDGDGDLDLAAGNSHDPNKVYLNVNGMLQTKAAWSSVDNDSTQSVAWGDVDGDGDLDLAAGNYQRYNRVYLSVNVMLQTAATWSSTGSDNTQSVAWGDVDGDGDLDLAVGNGCDFEICEDNKVYLNVNGVLQTIASWSSTDGGASSIAWGDVDGDGDLDLAAGIGNDYDPNKVYLNVNGILQTTPTWSSADNNGTGSVAWGDVDGDGDLDLAAGGVSNKVYRNIAGTLETTASWVSADGGSSEVAWGDVDGDGDFDLAAGNLDQPNKVYLNMNGTLQTTAAWTSADSDATTSVAWGDVDGDGDLDLVVGNLGQPNKVYLNVNGMLQTTAIWSSSDSDATTSVAWGDVDGDGDLDLVVGNSGPNQLYLNVNGTLQTLEAWSSYGGDETRSVALGDMDGDGDLDLAAGSHNASYMIFENGTARQVGLVDNPPYVQLRKVGTVSAANFFHTPEILTTSIITVPYTLFDPEGDPVRMIEAFYSMDGGGNWLPAIPTSDTIITNLEIKAYITTDGDDDFISTPLNINQAASSPGVTMMAWVYPTSITTGRHHVISSDNTGYDWSLLRDGATWFVFTGESSRSTGASVDLNEWQHIAAVFDPGAGGVHFYKNGEEVFIPYLAYDSSDNPIAIGRNPEFPSTYFGGGIDDVMVFDRPLSADEIMTYVNNETVDETDLSLHLPFNQTGGTVTMDVSSQGNHGKLFNGPTWKTLPQVFTWDTFASGFFGQSDNVVFRIEAYPSLTSGLNGTPVFMYPYASSTTFPFRVRGTQVRVFDESIAEGDVVQGALVYRLPDGQAANGFPLANGADNPFHTDQNGYLQGRGEIEEGDTLFALWPITATETYTMYYTNLVPSLSGAEGFVVTDPGVQNIAVSSAHPLILYNLDISLEWDARNDPIYLAQLQADLRLTSENLFDWTNGQAALGQIRIFHGKEHWNDADIRIYATNSLRPHAAVGGWVPEVLTETVTLNATDVITYAPGQVHIGAVWNSYGDPVGNLGDDWPRALAHELGHYLFFLDDNYLGLDASGYLISLSGCPGAMTDPYRNDDASGYDEFHPLEDWEEECADTLSNQETGRADWETLTRFFPWLMQPTVPCPNDTCFGPNGLPLAVTQFQIINPVTPTTTLEAPTFFLFNASGGMYQNSTQARAYLFHGDQLTDLGQPVSGQLTARGASPGDRLCVYDLPNLAQGCETISASDDQLVMTTFSNWQPDVRITPVTSVTHSLKVTAFDVSAPVLYARLYPLDSAPPVTITLNLASPGVYVGSYENLTEPVLEGYLHVWVDEADPRREIITDFSIGGDPGPRRSGGSGLAPVLSPDGQVILYGENLNFIHGEFYFLQSATILPQEVPWANIISKGYYLAGSQNAPPLNQTSLWFSYADGAVPPLQEEFIKVYFWGGNSWVPLATQVDTTRNSAVAKTAGPGLYVLMSSYEQSIEMDHPDWTPFFFPYTTPQAVGEALASIAGSYTSVCYKQTTDSSNPWRCYGAGAPNWANDLKNLEAKSYLIYLKESVVIRYKGSPTMAFPPNAPADFLIPPAVFYGKVGEINGIQPYEGIPIYALVNSTSCGQVEATEWSGQIVYVIDVYAEDFGTHSGCGTPDSPFTLQALGYVKDVIWDHTEFQNTMLGIGKLYLPIIAK